jgi:mRNA-degrading endonuclease toxin of MazEF toxin-antitoxin module
LPRKCAANFDNVRTVSKSALEARVGQLPSGRQAEAKRALGHALGWDELIDAK